MNTNHRYKILFKLLHPEGSKFTLGVGLVEENFAFIHTYIYSTSNSILLLITGLHISYMNINLQPKGR